MLLATLLACTAPVPSPSIAPPIGEDDAVHLLLTGDMGSDTREREQVLDGMRRRCAERPCDAILLLGDLLYPRGAESPDDPRLATWVAPYAAIAPTYLAVGNHDYGHGRDQKAIGHLLAWAAERPDIHLPSTVYRADLGDLATLAVLDTNHVFQHGDTALGPDPEGVSWSSQGAWLDGLPHDRPLIVVGHHTFRSNGPHGNAGAYEGWRHLPWVSGGALEALFTGHVAERALLYASGHDHNLQLLPCGGTTCAVSGAGAKTRELVDRGNPTHFQAAVPGFVALELDRDGGRIVAVDAEGEELAFVRLPTPAD